MPSGESNPRVGCLNGSCELACCKPPCDTLSSRPLYTAHSGCTASTCGARPRRRDLGPVTTRSRARVTSKCTHPSRVTDDIPAALDDGKGGDRTGLCPRFCRRGEASSRRHNALHRARGRRAAAPSHPLHTTFAHAAYRGHRMSTASTVLCPLLAAGPCSLPFITNSPAPLEEVTRRALLGTRHLHRSVCLLRFVFTSLLIFCTPN